MSRAAFQSQLAHCEARPVTLPRVDIAFDAEQEARERAAHFTECRIIKEAQDCWNEINRANSFENWKRIGAALSVGKNRSLFISRANRAMGRTYSREFNQWIVEHRFDGMAKSLRSVAIELHENIHAIEQWRTTLTDK